MRTYTINPYWFQVIKPTKENQYMWIKNMPVCRHAGTLTLYMDGNNIQQNPSGYFTGTNVPIENNTFTLQLQFL